MSPSTIPATRREVRLASRPQGALEPAHFTVAEVPVPEPGPGRLLVRNSLMGVAASLPARVTDGADSHRTSVPWSL